ncbi:hypothetical protein BG30_17845 [Bacillus subtilis subsp. subtilis]|nr:hypothetical protein BG30_17845 [Bacillus subtilis subsp. subtilis]
MLLDCNIRKSLRSLRLFLLHILIQQKQRKDAVMRQQPLLICKKRDEAASAHFIKANDSVHIIDRRILLQVTWLCEGSRVQL